MSGIDKEPNQSILDGLAELAQTILHPQDKTTKSPETSTGIISYVLVLHPETDTVDEIIAELTASDAAKKAKYVVYTNPAAAGQFGAAMHSEALKGRNILFIPQRVALKSRFHPKNTIFKPEYEAIIQTLVDAKTIVLQDGQAVTMKDQTSQDRSITGRIANTFANALTMRAFLNQTSITLATRAERLYNEANAAQIRNKIAWVEQILADKDVLAFIAAELPQDFYDLAPTKQYELLYRLLSKHTQDAPRVAAYDASQKSVAILQAEAEKIQMEADALKTLVPKLQTAITEYKENAPILAEARIAYLGYRLEKVRGGAGGVLMYPGGIAFATLDVARVLSKKEPAATLVFLLVTGGLTIADTGAEFTETKRIPADLLGRFAVYSTIGASASVMSVMAIESIKSLAQQTWDSLKKPTPTDEHTDHGKGHGTNDHGHSDTHSAPAAH